MESITLKPDLKIENKVGNIHVPLVESTVSQRKVKSHSVNVDI